jgi:hypothetical protein
LRAELKAKAANATLQDICLDWPEDKADPAAIGAAILAPDGPRLIRVIGAKTGPIYYVARCADVAAILHDPASFDLSLYDDALGASADDVQFILGVDSADRDERVALLRAAQGHVGNVLQSSKVLKSGTPPSSASFVSWVESIACAKSKDVLTCLYRDRMRTGQFNAVREYGYLVTYLCAQRIFGISGPDTMPLLVKAFMLARNVTGKGRILRPRDDFAAASTVLIWSHIIFGNLFGNTGGANAAMMSAAKHAAAAYNSMLASAVARGKADHPDTLLAGMFAVRGQFTDIPDERYARHMRAILFELIGAMTILVGTSFARIMQLTTGEEGKAVGIEWDDLVTQLASDDGHTHVIDECLRLNPTTTQLARRVAKPVMIGAIPLETGSIVNLLTGNACRDPRSFDAPDSYAPSSTREYLNFGPAGGPHACYGQHMARAILRIMIPALDKVAQPECGSFSSFIQLPDDMMWQFKSAGYTK